MSKSATRLREKKGGGKSVGISSAKLLSILRDRISNHGIAPGVKLSEQALLHEFGVPRARIREVFEALQQRGLIKRIPNRGAVVNNLDLAHVLATYAVREVLEGLCARLATQNVPPDSWEDLVCIYDKPMEDYIRKGDFEACIRELENLRRRMLEAANNPVLTDMLETVRDKTRAIIRRGIILPGRAEQGLKEHRALLAAMRRGDADEAERLARLNFSSAREYLERYRSFVL